MTNPCMSMSSRRKWTHLATTSTLAGCFLHKENTISCLCQLLQGCLTLLIFLPYHNLHLLISHPLPLVLNGAIVFPCRLLFISITFPVLYHHCYDLGSYQYDYILSHRLFFPFSTCALPPSFSFVITLHIFYVYLHL